MACSLINFSRVAKKNKKFAHIPIIAYCSHLCNSLPSHSMYVLVTYVPESHLEKVKQALFAVGCGKMDGYDQCCWATKGQGQFRPLAGSHPFLGHQNELEIVEEWRLEVIVEEKQVEAAIHALKEAHPYEVPAYHLMKVLTIGG